MNAITENLKLSENPKKKCSDCGLPEDRIHLCDRWQCCNSPILEKEILDVRRTEKKTITDSGMIDSCEFFNKVLQKMHTEGNGLLTTTIITPADATKMLLAHIIGIGNQSNLYIMECDNFLASLETSTPICSAKGCDRPMPNYNDVGAIIIVHGMCDNPETTMVAGVCSTCWKERFEQDADKALESFLDYLQQILPDMKVHDEAEFKMAGNAPSSTTVN